MRREQFKAGVIKEIEDRNAQGHIVFTSEGRYLVSVADHSPPTSAENPDEMTLAHAGQYQVVGNKLIEQVELSPTYALVGTSQKYYIDWTGAKLTLESTPLKDVDHGIAEITTFVFERSQ